MERPVTANLSPYDRLLARQRRQSKAYRQNKRAARAPDARDVGALLYNRYIEKRAANQGSDDALIEALAERGFDRDATAAVLKAAVDRARQDGGTRPEV